MHLTDQQTNRPQIAKLKLKQINASNRPQIAKLKLTQINTRRNTYKNWTQYLTRAPHPKLGNKELPAPAWTTITWAKTPTTPPQKPHLETNQLDPRTPDYHYKPTIISSSHTIPYHPHSRGNNNIMIQILRRHTTCVHENNQKTNSPLAWARYKLSHCTSKIHHPTTQLKKYQICICIKQMSSCQVLSYPFTLYSTYTLQYVHTE